MRREDFEEVCEFDDYPMPEYDLTLTEEERKQKYEEALADLKRVAKDIRARALKAYKPSQQ